MVCPECIWSGVAYPLPSFSGVQWLVGHEVRIEETQKRKVKRRLRRAAILYNMHSAVYACMQRSN